MKISELRIQTENPRARLSRPHKNFPAFIKLKSELSSNNQFGFTLIEMMVVLSIMLILLALALPSYNHSIIRAREGVLRQDLFTLRSCINQYTEDKQKAPQSLDDLVSGGYLKQLPVDPFTNSNSSWQPVQEDILDSVDQQEPGISDVHSGSNQTSFEGTAYSEW